MKKFRILVALMLAACMILPAAGTFSETVYHVEAVNGEIYVSPEQASKVVTGTTVNADVVNERKQKYGAVAVENYEDGKETELTINGNVTTQYEFQANGVGVSADMGSASVTVNGDVTAETKFATDTEQGRSEGKANGVMATTGAPNGHENGKNASASITVTGDVTAKAYTDPNRSDNDNGEIFASAAESSSEGEGCTAETKVEGDVTALSDVKAIGATSQAIGDDASAETSVGGDVNVEGSIFALGTSVNVVDGSASATVSVGGDVTVKADYDGETIYDPDMRAYGGMMTIQSGEAGLDSDPGTGMLDIGGTIAVDSVSGWAIGIDSQVVGNGSSEIIVGEGITAKSEKAYAGGIVSGALGKGNLTGEVNGDIEAAGATGAKAVQVETASGIDVTADYVIFGGLTATASEAIYSDPYDDYEETSLASAVFVRNGGGDIAITTIGDMTVDGAGDANAIDLESRDAWRRIEGAGELDLGELEKLEYETVGWDWLLNTEIIHYVAEDGKEYDLAVVKEREGEGEDEKITYRYIPFEIYVPEGTTTILQTGDVTSNDVGVKVNLFGDEQTADIVVDGTLAGENSSVVLVNETEIGGNLTLTVWKVEENKDKAIVSREDWDEEGEKILIRDAEAEKAIQYIIRIAEDSKDNITTDARDYKDYKVANEGETVTLKLDIPDGYELDGVFADVDQKVQLLQDPNGNYYLVVPRGGGVELSVKLKEKKDDPQPEPEPEPQPEPVPVPDDEAERFVPVQVQKATMPEAEGTPETDALRGELENADNILDVLPQSIVAELPENAKLVDILTLTLKNYDKAMGGVSFTLSGSWTFEAGDEVPVVLALPGETGTEWFYVKGAGMENGDVQVTLDETTLAKLAGKTFLALLFGQER